MENTVQPSINELIKRRYEELDELLKKGIQPFEYSFNVNSDSETIKSTFVEGNEMNVSIAGRIMAIRRMGKASFAHIQDHKGRIQIYLKKDDIGEYYDIFKLMDIGDIIGVEGFVFKTKTGEISVHTKLMKLLSKSLLPLPIAKEVVDEQGNKTIFDQFADKELRYRRRYLDLIVNPEIKDVFIKRSKIISSMRNFLDSNNYLEVETPVLQPLYGGASARPFITYHNTLDTQLYLRIADELYLKRLIVGGFNGVYEISKDFRNEGMDRSHNPEFTMMELYVPYKDYNWMMEFVESMFEHICKSVFNTLEFQIDDKLVSFKAPWKRVSMIEEIQNKTGLNILNCSLEDLKNIGYLITWKLTNFVFIEHFEIFSEFRSLKYGSEIIGHLYKNYSHIVLEAEPADQDETAARRISFYERNGFMVIDENYVQPCYAPDKNSLSLWLLANWQPEKTDWIKEEIYDVVYC